MKKIIFVFSLFMATEVFAKAGCLSEPLINKALEESLKKKCEEFPEMIDQVGGVNIQASGTLTLTAEDAARLNISQLNIHGIDDGLDVILKGKVFFQNANTFRLIGKINKVDLSQGDLQFTRRVQFVLPFRQEFLRWARYAYIWEFTAGPDDIMDFENASSENVIIYGGKEIRNLIFSNWEAGVLRITGSVAQPIKMVNVAFSARTLELTNVVVESIVEDYPQMVTDSLEMENAIIKPDISVYTGGGARTVKMINSYMKVVPLVDNSESYPIELLDRVVEVELRNSQLIGAPFPWFSGLVTKFEVYNSTVYLDCMPEYPNAEIITLTGKSVIKDQTKPIRIHEKLKALNLSDNHLSKLSIDLVDPKNLFQIYLMGNPQLELELLKTPGLAKLPMNFSMFVDTKEQAEKFRRQLKRKGVAFLDWLPLKPAR